MFFFVGNLERAALGIFFGGTKETALMGILGETLEATLDANFEATLGATLGEALRANVLT